jgi:hypothetical protein
LKPRAEDIPRIECDGSEYSFNVGDAFYFQFHRHGSVGEDAEFEISEGHTIEHFKTEMKYLHPEKMKPGWTGGDAERGQWFFKAVQKGKAILLIRTLFRFEVESECSITIIVD